MRARLDLLEQPGGPVQRRTTSDEHLAESNAYIGMQWAPVAEEKAQCRELPGRSDTWSRHFAERLTTGLFATTADGKE